MTDMKEGKYDAETFAIKLREMVQFSFLKKSKKCYSHNYYSQSFLKLYSQHNLSQIGLIWFKTSGTNLIQIVPCI